MNSRAKVYSASRAATILKSLYRAMSDNVSRRAAALTSSLSCSSLPSISKFILPLPLAVMSRK